MSELSTCQICKEDERTEDMMPDISGALYCYRCADICLSCGVYEHDCEDVNA